LGQNRAKARDWPVGSDRRVDAMAKKSKKKDKKKGKKGKKK
jgi:hypothetical protein